MRIESDLSSASEREGSGEAGSGSGSDKGGPSSRSRAVPPIRRRKPKRSQKRSRSSLPAGFQEVEEMAKEPRLAVPRRSRAEIAEERARRAARRLKDLGPSLCRRGDLEAISKKFAGVSGLVMRLPEVDERPWKAPPGWFTAYTFWFTESHVRFPLPKLLTGYCEARGIALSQLCPSAVRNIFGTLVLASELGIEVTLRFFETMSSISVNPTTPGTLYVSIKSTYGLLTGPPSKTTDWFENYFFVRVNEASVLEPRRPVRNEWSPSFGRHSSFLAAPDNFSEDIDRLVARGRVEWKHLDEARAARQWQRIENARWRLPAPRPISASMGKISLNLPRFGLSLPPPESSNRSGSSRKTADPPRADPVQAVSSPPEPLPLTPARETSNPETPGNWSPEAVVNEGSSPRTPTPPAAFLPTTPGGATPARSSDAGDRNVEPEGDGRDAAASREVEAAPRARKSKKSKKRRRISREGEEDAVQHRAEEAGEAEEASVRHSFSFQYEGKRPFLHSGKGCASLCEKLKLSLPHAPALEGKNLYRELAQSSLLTIGLTNQLIDYERRKADEEKSSQRELDEVKSELEEARERSATLESRSADMTKRAETLANSVLKMRSEVDAARGETASLKKEVAHLREREAELEENARRECLRLRKSRERKVLETKNMMLNEF